MFKNGLATFFASLTVFSGVLNITNVRVNKLQVLGVQDEQSFISPLAEELPSTAPFPSFTPSPIVKPTPTSLPISTPTPKPSATPTPTPTPLPSPSPITLSQLDDWFTKYANKESVDRDLLKKIAYCESKFNPNATYIIYGGLYQFSSSTWKSTRRAMNQNVEPKLRFDAEEAIKTAAFRLATIGKAAWPNCNK